MSEAFSLSFAFADYIFENISNLEELFLYDAKSDEDAVCFSWKNDNLGESVLKCPTGRKSDSVNVAKHQLLTIIYINSRFCLRLCSLYTSRSCLAYQFTCFPSYQRAPRGSTSFESKGGLSSRSNAQWRSPNSHMHAGCIAFSGPTTRF